MAETLYNNKQGPVKPLTREEWEIWERYREVSHCFSVDGARGAEAHRIILERLRTDIKRAGLNPAEFEQKIIEGQHGDMVKEMLLLARFRVGEILSDEERDFLKSHNDLIQ